MTRQVHDTAFGIASALAEAMGGKLPPADSEAFHKLAYDTAKAAIEQHDVKRDRERDRMRAHRQEAATTPSAEIQGPRANPAASRRA
jgi:hypothetical protein